MRILKVHAFTFIQRKRKRKRQRENLKGFSIFTEAKPVVSVAASGPCTSTPRRFNGDTPTRFYLRLIAERRVEGNLSVEFIIAITS